MTREEFMDIVYSELHSDGDNYRANRIIDAADEYAEEQEPCKDVVSRQAVIDAIDKWVKSMHVLITLPANEVTPLFESVNELPFVTPQQKIGKWIYKKEEDSYRCSLCSFPCHKDNLGAIVTRYCAGCGARMEGVE